MKFVRFDRFQLSLAVLLVFCQEAGLRRLHAEPVITADSVIQKTIARAQRPVARVAPDFDYTKVTLTEELDATGKVRERKEKVYSVSFRSGCSRTKLLAINGRPPSAEDRKAQSENEVNLRHMLGGAKPGARETSDNFLTPEIAERFDFNLVGETNLNGRITYQLRFQPKSPEPPVHHIVDKLLNRISGTLWIDREEYEIARADIALRSEVNLLGGVAGSLKKLAYTLVRTRIADGLWFNTLSSGDIEGRKLLDSVRLRTKSEATHFERAS